MLLSMQKLFLAVGVKAVSLKGRTMNQQKTRKATCEMILQRNRKRKLLSERTNNPEHLFGKTKD